MEREISIILKVRGAQAAKKAVQDVFNQQTQSLVKGFNQQTKKSGENMEKVAKSSKKAKEGLQSFTKVLGRGMAALYLYNRAWDVFGRNFESGMQLERAGMQFEMNIGRVTEMLPVLRTATRGIVSDFELLNTANRAFQQGLKPQNMGKAFKMATVAAQRLGLNATDAIKTITNAITKQDEGALNTLGIVTKVNQAYKTQAAMIAKTGGVMSNAMSIQLRQSLIMQELEKRFGGVNRVQDDGLSILERLRASWGNFRAELGITLGSALRPIIQVLTGFLDVTTRVLDKLNDTSGFKAFVRGIATLGIALGSIKLVGTIKSLASLLGVFSKGKTVMNVAKTAFQLRSLGSLFSLVPGWGLAITGLTLLWDPLVNIIKKAWVAGKVFFQLLNNFDASSGLSKVLKEDVSTLGTMYNLIENIAKLTLNVGAVLSGLGQGISDAFSPVINMFTWVGNKVSDFAGWLFDVKKTAVVAQSGLDSLTNSTRNLVKYLGFGVSLLASFVPGLQVLGGVGVAAFGSAIVKDLGLPDFMADAVDWALTPSQEAAPAGAPQPQPQSAPSTQFAQPAVRSMHLESKEDSTEVLKQILKENKKSNTMTEEQVQKEEIKNSQNQARGNILLRR